MSVNKSSCSAFAHLVRKNHFYFFPDDAGAVVQDVIKGFIFAVQVTHEVFRPLGQIDNRLQVDDFRKRRIEKNLTREQVAEKSGVAVANIVRFEQKGLISLKNLIGIAMAMEYTSEVKNILSEPKYSTMEELTQIRKNTGKTRAHKQ